MYQSFKKRILARQGVSLTSNGVFRSQEVPYTEALARINGQRGFSPFESETIHEYEESASPITNPDVYESERVHESESLYESEDSESLDGTTR